MLGSKFIGENSTTEVQQQQQHSLQHPQQQQQQQQQLQHSQQQQQQMQQPLIPTDSKAFSASEENRHYLKVFIQTYHDLPILWDTTLRDYSNRDKRTEAYEQLVPIYRYLKRDANLTDVKKKINTLRTNYRKELKMIEVARRQGNVYQPRCWTFYELDFLRNAEKFLAIDPNHNHIKTEPPSNVSPSAQFPMFNESTHQGNFLEISPYGFRMNNGESPPPNVTQMFQKSFGDVGCGVKPLQSTGSLHTPPPALERLEGGQSDTPKYDHQLPQTNSHVHMELQNVNQNKRLRVAASLNTFSSCKCSANNNNFNEEEALTRTWAYKLKRLSREQRLYAEKFVNDILFEAETGTLHRGSMQLNAFEPYVRFEESQAEDNISNASRGKSQSPLTPVNNSPKAVLPGDPNKDFKDIKNIEIQENQNGPANTGYVDNEGNGGQNGTYQNYN